MDYGALVWLRLRDEAGLASQLINNSRYLCLHANEIWPLVAAGGSYQNGGGGGGDYDGASQSGQDAAVFVSNLQWWTTDAELEALCSQFGQVTGIRFIEDRACGKSRGMAVVEFAAQESVQACISGLSGKDINGRPCRVSQQMQRGGPGGPGPGRGGGGMPGRGGMGGGMQMGGGRGGGRGRGGMGMDIGMGVGMDPSMGMGMWPGMGMMPGMPGMMMPQMGMMQMGGMPGALRLARMVHACSCSLDMCTICVPSGCALD
jgi:cleavage and polyadenylation specificity factor subunit 6/7